ncbi:MAG: MFS transporter [Anaerolineae bacterium]|nr:MFS transporter [Anaerolineae bacterium]
MTTTDITEAPAAPTLFTRDSFTWLAYLMLGYYAYLQASLGPLMPFLSTELNLNYTISGLHFSAYALGMTLAGLTGERAAQRWGRRVTFWGGAVGMAASGILLTVGRNPIITILSSLAMGYIGSLMLVMIQAALADRHGNKRTIALTEANIGASLGASLIPLLIGFGQNTGLGWRIGLYAAAAALGLLALRYWHTAVPEAPDYHKTEAMQQGPLPPLFWVYWGIVVFSTSIEWCTIFWGADFLEKVVGLNKIDAASLVSVFFIASVTGRLVGSRLTRILPGSTLLMLASGITLVGFLCFWLAPVALLNIVGMFITGFGVSNLYPLTLSAATSLVPQRSNIASARMSMGSGTAILIAPQLLGWAADHIGIYNAYGIVTVMLVMTAVMAFTANRLAPRDAALPAQPA